MSVSIASLVTFGRTDPLRLTEATHDLLGDDLTYVWGPGFNREKPAWALTCERLTAILDAYDVVYCGHGATLLEATAAGCEVRVLTGIEPVTFDRAWGGPHLDHSGKVVRWWETGTLARMAAEIAGRRKVIKG